MELNGYTLIIRPGTENNGYVSLPHNTQYSIFLVNDNETRCDVRVFIDGTVVGVWRIDEEDSIKLERGVEDTGRFTFYKHGTKEAEQAELTANDDLGLIKCQFLPELKIVPQEIHIGDVTRGGGVTRSSQGSGMSAGGTGLSGNSNQIFNRASQIANYDYDKVTTIYLRLVCENDPVQTIRPLRKSSTNIPRSLF